MATTNTRYVDPNSTTGGDGTTNALTGAARAYVSLNAWEAARQADLPTGDIIEKVICSSDDAGSTHAADTTAVTIDGWTTDATRYIQIEAASSHGGKWNANIYRLEFASAQDDHRVRVIEGNVRFIGLQIDIYSNTLGNSALNLYAAETVTIYISKCIIKKRGTGTGAYGVQTHSLITGGSVYIYNCIIYDFISASSAGISDIDTHSTANIYNCTIQNCTTGVNGSVTKMVNTAMVSCGTNATGTFAAGTDYNLTDDASIGYTVTGSGNTHDVVNATVAFVNAAGDDFHLAAGDGCIDVGVSDPGSGLFSDDIDSVTRSGSWDIGADEYVAAGGTAHPYTGGVGDGAITYNTGTQRSRGIVRELGGSQAYSAGTVRARGKVPSVGGGQAYSAATERGRGKSPVSGGTRVFSAGSAYSNVTLYIYTGGGAQVYGADTVKSRGKSPVVGGSQVYGVASEYSKYDAPEPTAYAYVGQGVIVFADGSEHALGKVYTSGGAFVFSGGAVYVKTTGSRAYSYAGLSTGAIVYKGATVYFKTAAVPARSTESKPGARTPVNETVPYTGYALESKPGSRTASQEAKPQRPAGQDGAYTDPAQDGVWDEYPVDGAYTDIGYMKEFKPRRRATTTTEGKPS